MTVQTLDATAFASSHPDVAKRVSISSILFSIFMLLVGLFSFATVFRLHDKSSSLSMALMVAGTALVLYGIYSLFWHSKETIYLPTGSVAKEQSLFFDLKHLDTLKDMIEYKHPDAQKAIRSISAGNLRMDIMLTHDNRFAAVQLFQFVPYSYVPVTSVCYFTGSEAAAFSAFVSRCRMTSQAAA